MTTLSIFHQNQPEQAQTVVGLLGALAHDDQEQRWMLLVQVQHI